MKSIWKYELPPEENITLQIPKGAEVLTVQVQNETPCIWAVVDPDAETEERYFSLLGTGFTMDFDINQYIGTFQLGGGELVLHLFEVDG